LFDCFCLPMGHIHLWPFKPRTWNCPQEESKDCYETLSFRLTIQTYPSSCLEHHKQWFSQEIQTIHLLNR
jgi:hypothetical protein